MLLNSEPSLQPLNIRVFVVVLVFETMSHYVDQAGLELRFVCPYLPGAEIKDVYHHSQPMKAFEFIFVTFNCVYMNMYT